MAEPARATPFPPDERGPDGVLGLAEALRREGREADSLVLFEHLAELRPDDPQVLRGLAAGLGAAGRTLEALHRLMRLKSLLPDAAVIVDDIRAQSASAAEKFNAHIRSGEVDQAEAYAAALAALVPASEPMLNAAMACNQALGRLEQAQVYARALLALDPSHAGARAVLAIDPEAAGTEARIAALLGGAEPVHPLVRLRDIHDLSSRILCGPLTDEATGQVARLLEAARTLQVPVEPGSDWAAWEKHYRVLLQAIELDAVVGPTPDPGPAGPVDFIASDGSRLSAKALRATADRLGARAVFFAAADARYVELYARWYVLSILKHCDAPFLIVVHVIGGAGALKQAARTVGVTDERLVFAGDRFDAEAVTTRCYDAPPKGRAALPIAHFQSVRFQRLGELLRTVDRPVFVSDIDLLLQRGVADLLDRHASADLVFNENEASWNAGSRLTANLLLAHPTANAQVFLNFLRAYLDRVLAGEEVTRWIDQVALVLARHHLQRRGEAPRIGYFDTSTDINNVMYPSYQENPFRFLSLYHGFDTSSLEEGVYSA